MGTTGRIRTKVRHGASRARATRPWRALRPIAARSVFVVDETGGTLLERHPDLPAHGRSTIKLLTALTARDLLDMDSVVTVTEQDTSPHTVLAAGDTLTVADLLHSCLIYSDNTATLAVARTAGYRIPGKSDPLGRFLGAMRDRAPGGWVITDPRGFGDDNTVTARGMVALLCQVASRDPWLHDVASRKSHTLTVTGAREEEIPIENDTRRYLMDPVAAKSGTDGSAPTGDAHVVWSWVRPGGTVATAAVMGTDKRNRPLDVVSVQRIVG